MKSITLSEIKKMEEPMSKRFVAQIVPVEFGSAPSQPDYRNDFYWGVYDWLNKKWITQRQKKSQAQCYAKAMESNRVIKTQIFSVEVPVEENTIVIP